MVEKRFTSVRLIDGKPRKVIIDEIGNIINRNPTKEDLLGLGIEPYIPKKKRKVSRVYYRRIVSFYETVL